MIICELIADIVIGVISSYIVKFIDKKRKNNRHDGKNLRAFYLGRILFIAFLGMVTWYGRYVAFCTADNGV